MTGHLRANIILVVKSKVSSPRKDYQDFVYRSVKENTIEKCAGRNYNGPENLVRWTSWNPNNPFAPKWDVPLWYDNFPEEFVDNIIDKIYLIEEELGDWKHYNVFAWSDKFPFVNKLLILLKTMYGWYMEELGYDFPNKIYIRGWLNILEPGELLPIHSHSFHENSFISGNLLLTDSEVSTEYVIPNYSTYCGNYLAGKTKGSVLLFPSWVEHFVPEVKEKRYCIAFDFYTDEAMQYVQENATEFDPMMLSIEC